MMKKSPLLQVKDLRISFRTLNGTVKAVRGINFALYRGRTLGIVGESGSGKSVTSRAILGILAGNKIIEGGQIIYDGHDLLQMSEKAYGHIRGSRISMIFQDPMSSLNPIMKVGRQLSEAMMLKNRAIRHEAKKRLAKLVPIIQKNNGPSFKKLYDDFASLSLVKGEKVRVTEAKKLLQERLDVLFDSLLINVNAFNNSTLKRQIPELNFLVKATLKTSENANSITEYWQELISIIMAKERETIPYERIRQLFIEFKAEIIASIHGGEKDDDPITYDESFKHLLLNAVRHEFSSCQHFVAESLDYISSLQETYLEKPETFSYHGLKKQLPALSKLLFRTINRLDPRKDEVILTFPLTIARLISSYEDSLTFAQKQASFAQMNEKQQMKMRAFGREFLESSTNIYRQITQQFNDILNHLRQLIDAELNEEKAVSALVNDLTDCLMASHHNLTKRAAKNKAIHLLRDVGISEPEKRIKQYPFQFSGGMRQRIVIAIALSSNPEILICDEPTTALDVTIQSQILDLINKLKKEKNLSVIFITHDLGVIANMADDIAVMYAGKIVEYGTVNDIFYEPKHPYTWALLASMPDLNTKEKLDAIPGTPPNMILPPAGDAFAARNKYAMSIDFEEEPPMFKVSSTHYAATWLLHPQAPRVEPPRIVKERIHATSKTKGGRTYGK